MKLSYYMHYWRRVFHIYGSNGWGVSYFCGYLFHTFCRSSLFIFFFCFIHGFRDLIFEASSTMPLVKWKCNSCSSLVPHLHVHKVIVESSCDYLRALFQSGMRERYPYIYFVGISFYMEYNIYSIDIYQIKCFATFSCLLNLL